jgi:hypothetical protein
MRPKGTLSYMRAHYTAPKIPSKFVEWCLEQLRSDMARIQGSENLGFQHLFQHRYTKIVECMQ